MGMTIDEAIKGLQELGINTIEQLEPEFQDALKLGIEALKAWKQFREGRWVSGRSDLPGETKQEVNHDT